METALPTATEPPEAGGNTDGPRPIAVSPVARLAVAGAVIVYFVAFSRWTARNHDGYGTFGFDLGIYDQGLWLLSRFHRPFVTIMGRHLFGDHTSFILLPLVPVYWLVPSAKVLLVAQSGALAVAAVPAFLLGREKLRNEALAAGLAVALLLHPAVAWANFEQFHPDVFEVPLVLLAFYAVSSGRWRLFVVSVFALLMVKEDAALVAVPLGLYVAWKHHRRLGLLVAAGSALYAMAALWWILPAFNEVGTLNTWRIPFGGPRGLVKTALAHPPTLARYLWSDGRPWYAWQLLAPFGLLALLAPSVAAVAAVPLLANVVSTFWYQYHLQYHYTAAVVPGLLAATVFGVAALRNLTAQRVAVAVVLLLGLWTAWLWGPTPFSRHPAPIGNPASPTIASVEAAIRLIPRDAVVSAHYGYVTHLDHRRRIYEFPVPWRARYWGTFDREGQRLPEADDVDYLLVPRVMSEEYEGDLTKIRDELVLVHQDDVVRLFRARAAGAR